MLNYTKKSEFLICIDSDGTVMDTMTIKHERAFGPCFIKVMGIKHHVDDILTHWNYVNLYSITRGINRFQGFDEICHYIKDHYQIEFDGLDEFDKWVETTKEFSANSIAKYMETSTNTSLFKKALEWSKNVNEAISALPPSQPFDNVKEGLEAAYGKCDLVGVSSANKEAVKEEWTRLDLMKYFSFVGCQDVGNKSLIIKNALENGYDKKKAVMLGDAKGDLKAAMDNGIYFFPIIPKNETSSWKLFINEGLLKLLDGSFDEQYQQKLITSFYDALK